MGAARITLIVFTMASILVLAGFSTILNEKAYAGENINNGFTPPPFGDFTCWISVDLGQTVAVPLRIEDQFGPIENSDWEQIEYCTATNKFIGNSDFISPFSPGLSQHYQGWLYPTDPSPTIGPGTGQTVIINVPQFGQQFQTTLLELDEILVPATKFLPSEVIVDSFDTEQHWNCYLITGPAPDVPPVDLRTQHGEIAQVSVGESFLFCAPMIKTVLSGPNTGVEFGSNTIAEHMICYDILAGLDASTDLPFALQDQLTPTGIDFIIDVNSAEHPLGLEKLCVPAFKSFPTVGGSMVPINTSALLLAGVQSISMWMIPVVIAGVGISIFVAIRRK